MKLSGNTAFFKKPEVNTYYYFTYGHIHKVALLGLFGAILGYKGYTGKLEFKSPKKKELSPGFPEFYEKLKHLQVSVVPLCPKCSESNTSHSFNGVFAKKIQAFNNSVGYASQEQGGNLIVKEQWLEYPAWEVYVKVQDEEGERLAAALQNHTCVYQPYLGKNDHMADITEVSVININTADVTDVEEIQISSLFPEDFAILDDMPIENDKLPFCYKEVMPSGLDSYMNLYEFKTMIYTNLPVEDMEGEVFEVNEKYIAFY